MAGTFKLEIVTPDREVVNTRAEQVQVPGKSGYLGVLAGHAPLITELGVGEISYNSGARTEYLAVAWGFAEVLPDRVTILAETAERPEEIDVARAEQAKNRAEETLRSGGDVDWSRWQAALQRSLVRLQVAQRRGQ
jgi:F-type H+-transporting ATPase subunit epsilon